MDDDEVSSYVPKIGMTFDSEEDVRNFYNTYGQIVGFSTRIQHSKKEGNTIMSRTYVFSKEGYRKADKRDHLVKNHTAETRSGCQALLRVKLCKDTQKYVIYDFVAMHNNHSVVQNVLSHMLPSQRKISQAQATEIELAADSGIDLRLAHELMGKESGGRECIGFLKVDHKNYLRTRRQKMLAFGEVGIISNYFLEKRQENPSFYHDVQLDSEEKITNIFWADASMISDYQNFGAGDAVRFDTTYKINNENRPFAVFVGFNNHREITVFGAALMYDETADSFVWLFQTFLKAMSNKHPKTIFTDQDAAMAKAILLAMPNTYHRLCKWHMMQNAFKHVGNIFKGPDRVRGVFAPFFDDYEDEIQFIEAWETLLADHSLQDNSWLRSIFDLRRKWGRSYVRWSWSAGMRSTQLSESLNATLKDYLKSDYNLGLFFTHFDRAVENIRHKEKDAEFSLEYKLPKIRMKSIQMLIQAGEVLRDELCLLQLPDHYILKRWTKKARAQTVTDWSGREIDVDPKLARNTRFKELATSLIKLAGRACETEITTNILRKYGKEASENIEEVLHSMMVDKQVQTCQEEFADRCFENVGHAKGLKKKPYTGPRGRRRLKSSLEKALASKRKKTIATKESQRLREDEIPNEGYAPNTHTPQIRFSQASQMTEAIHGFPPLETPLYGNWPLDQFGFTDERPIVQPSIESSLWNGSYRFDLNEVFDNGDDANM